MTWKPPSAARFCWGASMRMEELFELARQLGAERRGVVTAAQLRLAGADPDTVKAARRRHWQTPVRGIYVPHRRELSAPELAHVAVAHAGPGSVVTGLVAARALQMRWVPELVGVMVLVAPHLRRRGSEGLVLVRRCTALPGLVTSTWEGVLLAPPARIVADACHQVLAVRAAELGERPSRMRRSRHDARCLREIRGLVLGAVADGHCSAQELLAVVDDGPMRGSALVRRACHDALRGAASPPEAELVDGLLAYGVPFYCNVELWDGDVLVAVLDVYLAGTGVGGEMDSKEVHAAADLLDLTLLRHGRVERYGVKLCHVTPSRYRANPVAFHEELFEAVLARQAGALGDPVGLRLVPRGPLLCGPRRGRPPYRPTLGPDTRKAAA